MKTISLHKELQSGGWHSSIVTTYSVDPTFYDMYIERQLRRYGSQNNILIADDRMLKRALNATPEAFAAAGCSYAVVPVKVAGAFHPKLHLRLGAKGARLVVGSANATAAGWGRNQEVISVLDWRLNGDSSDEIAKVGPLIASAYAYLNRWLEAAVGEAIPYKLHLLRRKSPWLQDLEPSDGPIELRDGTAVNLLCEGGGDTPSILEQFTDLARQDKVRKLIVVSPYWDADLSGLRELRHVLDKPATYVVMNPKKSTFPVDALAKSDALKFVAFHGTKADRFLHAKILVVETNRADHVLFGSANCSDDALGLLSSPARNAEVSVYRRLARGTVLDEFGIDLSKLLARSRVRSPTLPLPVPASERTSISGGVMELVGRELTWWPPNQLDGAGATIQIARMVLTPMKRSRDKWRAKLSALPAFPVVARVTYRGGRISDPVIVHAEDQLRRAAPSAIDAGLNDALSRARSGEEDLHDLVLQAHVVFAPEPTKKRVRGIGGGKRTQKGGKAVQYSTAEEFRKAVSMRAATGMSGRFAESDPGLQEVMSTILHGISANPVAEIPESEEDDRALLDGDTEDDPMQAEDGDDESEGQPSSLSTPTPPIEKKKGFTVKEVERRRTQLIRVLEDFEELLDNLSKDPSKITPRVAGQTMFVFWLMRYGCKFIHPGVHKGLERLMLMTPSRDADRDHSFSLRAVWILKRIWEGEKSIASYIGVDSGSDELQDDLFGLVVVSRWALARAYLAAAAEKRDVKLAQRIGLAVGRIFKATIEFGPVEPEAERRNLEKLDADMGCSQADTKVLLRFLQDIANPVTPARVVQSSKST